MHETDIRKLVEQLLDKELKELQLQEIDILEQDGRLGAGGYGEVYRYEIRNSRFGRKIFAGKIIKFDCFRNVSEKLF